MSRKLEELSAQALELDLESRAALAKRLLESLDEISPEEHERLWVEEAAARYDELREGKVGAIPSEAVFQQLENRSRS